MASSCPSIKPETNPRGESESSSVPRPPDEHSFAFVEYQTPQQAIAACKAVHGTPIDRRHTFGVNKITDIDRYGKEGKIHEEYEPPKLDEFHEKEHLRWWLGDSNSRDQFVLYRGDGVGVYWNKKRDNPEQIIDRQHWTEKFVQWSPLGTYLATIHIRGMQLWGGHSWSRQTRFPHPYVDLVDFSPNENYLCTWSFRPIEVAEDDPILSQDDDGKNYIIWDLSTGRPLRSFAMYDLATAPEGPDGQPVKKQVPWPAFKWSADDKYVARMKEGEGIHVYELPSMKAMDKKKMVRSSCLTSRRKRLTVLTGCRYRSKVSWISNGHRPLPNVTASRHMSNSSASGPPRLAATRPKSVS